MTVLVTSPSPLFVSSIPEKTLVEEEEVVVLEVVVLEVVIS
jgi:hypothetical protein